MFHSKLHFKQCNYFALPASLRTFTISTAFQNGSSTPRSELHIRYSRTTVPRKIPFGSVNHINVSDPSSATDLALQQHINRRMGLAEHDPVKYLRKHLAEFQSKSTSLTLDELSRVDTILKGFSRSMRWQREQQEQKLGLPLRGAQKSVPASYYRGGTSRAMMVQPQHLPRGLAARRALFLHVMGSPDAHGRQLNGLGAGVSSLSKVCVVARSRRPDADVDYTFVGVGIEGPETDYAGNCGNMSAAVGPFAYNEKLLNGVDYNRDGEVEVMIFQTNTHKHIRSRFKVIGQQAQVDNETAIDGVSGMGTGVLLDFLQPTGSKTGKLLPTGQAVEKLCGIEVSCVDAANPCVFVRASDIGIDPTILPDAFLKEKETLRRLEAIRTAAAVAMGICKEGETPPRVIPKVGIVSPPVSQTTLSGATVGADQVDVIVRFISDAQPHRAIPVTAALCTAAAAKTEGSIVQQCLRDKLVDGQMITIGHPSGRIQVNAQKDKDGRVTSCSLVRTARRLWDGRIYWSEDPNLAQAKNIDEAVPEKVFAEQDSHTESDEQDDNEKPQVRPLLQ